MRKVEGVVTVTYIQTGHLSTVRIRVDVEEGSGLAIR